MNDKDGGFKFFIVYNKFSFILTFGFQELLLELDEAYWISYCTNTLGKGMNPIILPLAMGK